MNSTNLRILTLALVAATVLAVPTAAMAASPTVDGYATNGAQAQADVSSGGANDGGTLQQLPFTGLDLWFVAAGGLLLGLAGVALRRAVKSPAHPREMPPNP
ncbi:MAG: hypothetical protein ACXVRP_10325 [Solirubrobacteraceae bacterium]